MLGTTAVSERAFGPGQPAAGSAPRAGDAAAGSPTAHSPAASGPGPAVPSEAVCSGGDAACEAVGAIESPPSGEALRCTSSSCWEAAENSPMAAAAPTPQDQARRPTRSQAAAAAAAAPAEVEEGDVSAAALAERRDIMFAADAFAPRASGMGGSAVKTTRQLVQLAWGLVSEWPQAHVDALSRAYGNFDRVVAAGWLVGR